MTAIVYGAVAVSAKFSNNAVIYNLLIYGSSGLAVFWSLFVCAAIINASTYKRDRGFWGWAATILAGLGILRAIRSSAIIVGIFPLTFSDIQISMNIENAALPIDIGGGVSLEEMFTDRSDRSITYLYGTDLASIYAQPSELAELKKAGLESCQDFKDWLSGPVRQINMIWRANDGTTARIEILPGDCGY